LLNAVMNELELTWKSDSGWYDSNCTPDWSSRTECVECFDAGDHGAAMAPEPNRAARATLAKKDEVKRILGA
jgi:hypothetical protein